ncbi:hypothetical protein [Methanolobus sp. ZRKC5]|uniref:hypothetical protein n=1 Tax=unclassified Methanolobus TaxID=2629569 RepID=UPI00313D2E1E
MNRVCTTCSHIVDQEWVEKCPKCGGILEPYNPDVHVNYAEIDIDPDYETAKSWRSD